MSVLTELGPGAPHGALADYYEWYRLAAHGDVLIYHEGDLAFDRLPPGLPVIEGDDVPATPLSVLANRVRADAEEGFLRLTQRRLGPSLYQYRATRVRPVLTANFVEDAIRADPLPA